MECLVVNCNQFKRGKKGIECELSANCFGMKQDGLTGGSDVFLLPESFFASSTVCGFICALLSSQARSSKGLCPCPCWCVPLSVAEGSSAVFTAAP